MRANYPVCYSAVRQYEGGNDDDPQDPGGRTSRGIIQREWDKFRQTHPGRPADVWQASEDDIGAIYKNDYWDKQRGDDLSNGIDETTFDYGVNSGVGRSSKVLRRCLHLPDNATSDAVMASLRALDKDKSAILINAINDERMAFLKSLSTFKRFGGGWTKRVASVRTLSLRLYSGGSATIETPKSNGKGQYKDPKEAKRVIVTGGGVGGAAGASQFGPHEALMLAIFAAIAIGVAIYLINRWHQKRTEAPPKGWTPPPELKPSTGG